MATEIIYICDACKTKFQSIGYYRTKVPRMNYTHPNDERGDIHLEDLCHDCNDSICKFLKEFIKND